MKKLRILLTTISSYQFPCVDEILSDWPVKIKIQFKRTIFVFLLIKLIKVFGRHRPRYAQ